MSVKLLEAEDAAGGRIRTDQVEGFRLDRGFTSFRCSPVIRSSAQHVDVKSIAPAPILERCAGVARRPLSSFCGSVPRLAGQCAQHCHGSCDHDGRQTAGRTFAASGKYRGAGDLFRKRETPTRQFLEEYGFSAKMIDRFFTLFLAGVFLERELATSSRYFQFLFRMFAFSDAAVPENGMEMLPRQLAVRLRAGTLKPAFASRRCAATDADW